MLRLGTERHVVHVPQLPVKSFTKMRYYLCAGLCLLVAVSAHKSALADCLDDKLNALKGQSLPLSANGGVRSGTCGGCCLLGTCEPPSRRDTVRFTAPPGYTIEGPVLVKINSANGEGGVSDVAYSGDPEGRVTSASVDVWCKSQNQAAGAGAWRDVTLTGLLRRHVTPDDVVTAARQCGAH
jgi:hypothetical protein